MDDKGRRHVTHGTWVWNEPTLTMTLTRVVASGTTTDLDPPVVVEIQPSSLTRLCWAQENEEVCFTRGG